MSLADNILFRSANRIIRDEVVRAFRETSLGRLVTSAKEAYAEAGRIRPQDLPSFLDAWERKQYTEAMNAAARTDLGTLAREVETYSRGDTRRLLTALLESWGPTGRILTALLGKGQLLQDEISIMSRVLNSLGEASIPKGAGQKAIERAKEILEAAGHTVIPPGGGIPPRAPPGPGGGQGGGPPPPAFPWMGGYGQQGPEGGVHRQWVGTTPREQLAQKVGTNHPAVTGDMVPTPNSSNVHSVGYDADNQYIYVRYLGGKGKDRTGPGPIYRYWPWMASEFLDLYENRDHPGAWIWDWLRVRGSWARHNRNYQLVGIQGNYVPRQAMARPAGGGKYIEAFVPRLVTLTNGRTAASSRPFEVVLRPPSEEFFPDTGNAGRALTGDPNEEWW